MSAPGHFAPTSIAKRPSRNCAEWRFNPLEFAPFLRYRDEGDALEPACNPSASAESVDLGAAPDALRRCKPSMGRKARLWFVFCSPSRFPGFRPSRPDHEQPSSFRPILFLTVLFSRLTENPHSVFRQDTHANSSLKIRGVILMTRFLMRDYFDAGCQGLSCGMSLTQYRWIILNTRYSAGHDANAHNIPIAS